MPTLQQAKERLDSIINKGRVDLYKPIQIAEVLRRSRLNGDIVITELGTYQNPSLRWRDSISRQLLGKKSTSSARFQHDVWSDTAMPPDFLAVLDHENQLHNGIVEAYIYSRFQDRQGTVSDIINYISHATADTFSLPTLLNQFLVQAGIRRSIDKAYEIVTYALFETIVVALETTITVNIPPHKQDLLHDFADLAQVLLGLQPTETSRQSPAHIYRVGVTNAADRGLDMWANFGPAIQVKHLTLDSTSTQTIVDQVESDHVVIVCRDTDAQVISTISQQISWGQRVRGIVKESDLVMWYERCLRGHFSQELATPLLQQLKDGFNAEFPQTHAITEFLEERAYPSLNNNLLWGN